MDWSVFVPALAANLTGHGIAGLIFLYPLRLQRDLRRRWDEAHADENNT